MKLNCKYRILCIEDDERLLRLLTEDLEEAGYEVIAAGDAAGGLIEFFNTAPSLVLCDVRMPGISGFDLIERLRTLSPDLFGVAFVFLTALADRDNQLRGRRLGADDYITKPVDYEILREVVRVRLGGHDRHNPPGPLNAQSAEDLAAWLASGSLAPPSALIPVLHGQFKRSPEPAMPTATASPKAFDRLGALPIGVIILDRAGVIHYINESAAALFSRTRLDLLGVRAEATLTGFARRHLGSARGASGRMSAEHVVLGADGMPLPAIARTVVTEAGTLSTERVTVLLPHLPAAPPLLTDLLQLLFDLTPAEQRLAAEIGTGANLSDVARTRGVALGTVRSQLKSVFGKMGVTRQAELVRALLSLQFATGLAEGGA